MNEQTKKLTYTALLTALTFIMTSAIKIPLLTGYIHPGDGAVLLSAYILGPFGGMIAAGIGILLSMLPAIISMASVYYVSEVFMYGNISGPLINIPFSLLQGVFGCALVFILHKPLNRFRLKLN
ncbi:MAG: hypothetical protein PWP20_720 [Eubacteriaceae bacterium]|nr:hypothetical protein [Eubacteriaceae bacterium]